jgi:uncharacterized protein (TIGR02246 family)
MKRWMLALLLVPSLALAKEDQAGSQQQQDPMAGWVPPKVKNAAKDKQEIRAVFEAMEGAMRTGDIDAAVALIDFPVTMITDDSKGQAMGEAWDREKWTQMMKPFYAKPMKEMKVTHKPDVFLLSDSLASVDDTATMTMGGKSVTSRSSTLLARVDGKWRVKAMVEGGWGDTMGPQKTSSGEQPASSQGTGSASDGSGSSAQSSSQAQQPGAAQPSSGTKQRSSGTETTTQTKETTEQRTTK